jgi:flagellar biosynthesis protein FlhB
MSEKTQPPSERRLREATARGEVAHSKALTAALGLLLSSAILYFLAPPALGTYWRLLLQATAPDTGSMSVLSTVVLPTLAGFCGVFVALTLVAGLAIGLAQTRFQPSWKAMQPRPERLNPVQNLKQSFCLDKLADLLGTLLHVSVCGLVLLSVAIHALVELPAAVGVDEPAVHLVRGGRGPLLQLVQTGAALLPLALGDLWLKHRLRRRQLRMSLEDLRKERRDEEGQPEIKQRARHNHEQADHDDATTPPAPAA